MKVSDQQLNLPAGFRFHPTDDELVVHYLCRKCGGQQIGVPIVAELDLYKFDPWQLPASTHHDLHWQVVDIKRGNLDVDTSSYHCNIVRHMPLDSIDSSLAIGFYRNGKSDFDYFCSRASELIDQSNDAQLFTITETRLSPKCTRYQNTSTVHSSESREVDLVNELSSDTPENICAQEDDWQLL